MSNTTFGSQSRKLVHDTNQGKVAPPQKSTTSKGASNVGTAQDYDRGITNKSTVGMNAMLKTFQPSIDKSAQAEVDAEMTKAFNTPSAAEALAVANDEQGPISGLFGPTPEMRGLQQRIISDETTAYQAEVISGIKSGKYNSLTAEEFQTKMTTDLNTRMEKYPNDSEVQKGLVAHHSKVAARVAPHQMLGHEIFKQGVAADKFDSSIANAATALEAGQGDSAFAEDFAEAFKRKEPQTKEAWQNSSTKAILGVLANGQTHAYDVLTQNPEMVLNDLSPDQQKLIEEAHGNFIMSQTEEGYGLVKDINAAVAAGDKSTLETLVPAYNDYFPENPMSLTDAKLKADQVNFDKRLVAEEGHNNLIKAQQGLAETPEQLDALISHEATKYRDASLAAQLADGTISQDVYDDEIGRSILPKNVTQWANDRPEAIAAVLQLNPGVGSKLMKSVLAQNVSALSTPGELDREVPNDLAIITQMEQGIVLHDTLMKTSPEFVGNTLSDEQSAQMDRFSAGAVHGGDVNHTRHKVQAAVGETWDFNEHRGTPAYQSAMEEAADVYDDINKPWYMQSDFNNAIIQSEYERQYKLAYEAFGPQGAGPNAIRAMTRDAVDVQGVKHFGIKPLDKELGKLANKSGSVEGYMDNIQDNPEAMQGFEDDGFDIQMWGDQFEGVQIQQVGSMIHISQEKGDNGWPVTRSIPIPKTDADYFITDNEGALEKIQGYYPSDVLRPVGQKLAEKALIK